jgi:hypothetical protein
MAPMKILDMLKVFRLLIAVLFLVSLLIGAWLGLAWGLGWGMDHLFDLGNFRSCDYIAFGSCILVFTLVVQIITTSLTVWFLVSWGKARVKKVIPNIGQMKEKQEC